MRRLSTRRVGRRSARALWAAFPGVVSLLSDTLVAQQIMWLQSFNQADGLVRPKVSYLTTALTSPGAI